MDWNCVHSTFKTRFKNFNLFGAKRCCPQSPPSAPLNAWSLLIYRSRRRPCASRWRNVENRGWDTRTIGNLCRTYVLLYTGMMYRKRVCARVCVRTLFVTHRMLCDKNAQIIFYFLHCGPQRKLCKLGVSHVGHLTNEPYFRHCTRFFVYIAWFRATIVIYRYVVICTWST